MAQSSSSHQHSLLVPVPYDKQPTHSNTLPFTIIEAYTYSFYSCLSLQSMVPIIHAVIQPIRINGGIMTLITYRICSIEDGETRTSYLFIVGSEYHDDNDGAICIY